MGVAWLEEAYLPGQALKFGGPKPVQRPSLFLLITDQMQDSQLLPQNHGFLCDTMFPVMVTTD